MLKQALIILMFDVQNALMDTMHQIQTLTTNIVIHVLETVHHAHHHQLAHDAIMDFMNKTVNASPVMKAVHFVLMEILVTLVMLIIILIHQQINAKSAKKDVLIAQREQHVICALKVDTTWIKTPINAPVVINLAIHAGMVQMHALNVQKVTHLIS